MHNGDAPYSPIEIEYTLDVEKLRASLIQRLVELRKSWAKYGRNEPDIEIDKDRKLWVRGTTDDIRELRLYITNGEGSRWYNVKSFATRHHFIGFSEDGIPKYIIEYDLAKMVQDKAPAEKIDRYKKFEIKFETATGEELLKIADILKMYSEPYEYFGVGVEDKDGKSGQNEDETKPMKKGTRRLPLPRITRDLLQGE